MTSTSPSPRPTPPATNFISQQPKRFPRKAVISAHQTISTLYAPALLDDSTDSDSSSASTRPKAAKTHRSCRTPPTDEDASTDSDSDEFINDLNFGLPRSERGKVLLKRKRATRSKSKREKPGWADRELVAAAEGRRLRGSRFRGRNERSRKVDERVSGAVDCGCGVVGACEKVGICAEGIAALNAVTENELLEYCWGLRMGVSPLLVG